MKKLYSNIEEVRIVKDPNEVGKIITDMDKCVEQLAQATAKMTSVLAKYAGSNLGVQYDKASKAAVALYKSIKAYAVEINDVQNQVDRMIAKICEYDDRRKTSPAPRKSNIGELRVDVNRTPAVFTVCEMTIVRDTLANYVSKTQEEIDKLLRCKENVGAFWKDRQYRDFSDMIDQLGAMVKPQLAALREYAQYLAGKIKGLAS